MAERRQVGNLIKPRPVPAFTAATTSSARWIDGTAAGSTTDLGYGWYIITGVGDMAYSITEEGLTIAATTATGRGRCMSAPFEATTTKQNINNYGIPVQANTSYTFSYKAKGTNILASTTRAGVILFTTGGATVATPVPNHIPEGDSDWTDYSVTFTTGATVAYAVIYPGVFTAGNIMSATFKDFKLDTTTPTTRTTATSRTTATNRVAVRDMGTALRFAGGTDKVTRAGLITDFDTLDYTFSVWVKSKLITTNVAGTSETILGTGSGGAGAGTSYVYINLRNSLYQFRVQVIGGTDSTALTPQLPGRWVHLVGTVTQADKKLRIYVNGTLKTTSSTFASFGTLLTSTLSIGGGFNTALSGEIDDVRVWQSKALTATEIQNLYLYNIVPQDGLVAEYLFDEASGTTAIDTSGNGNDGTITGATYTTDVPLKLRTSI